jgi:NSS family neurotransmitter:Na+ symporter
VKKIFSPPTAAVDHAQVFQDFHTGVAMPLIWMGTFMLTTAVVVLFGVQKGIEKYSKMLVPLLVVFLIIFAIRGLTLPGSAEGLKFLFKPDFSKINGNVMLSALGQAAFSLSIGMGTMITFGSYIKRSTPLPQTAFRISIADTFIAMLAGAAIFPAVFAFGMTPEQGPGLVYVVLPAIFEQMPGGAFFAFGFFAVLIVAALTSSISMLEVAVAYFKEEFRITRRAATLLGVAISGVLAIFTTLAFGPLRHVQLFDRNIFENSDFFASNILLPLSMFFGVVFLGWFYDVKQTKDEITNQGSLRVRLFPTYMFIIRYIAPVAILLVFLRGVGLI